MNHIQDVIENLYDGVIDKTAKETKSINCGKAELSPKRTEALECCKKHDGSLKIFLDPPAALAAEFYPKCCFFITCIVARVFLMQCAAASKAN